MARKNKATQRPYGKKTFRDARAKLLKEKFTRECHEDYQKLNEQFRAGNPELIAQAEETKELVRLAMESGCIEEVVYLMMLENMKNGNPFRAPIWRHRE